MVVIRRKPKLTRILALLDVENLVEAIGTPSPERFSIPAGLNRLIKEITAGVDGIITDVFVFIPPHMTPWAETFHEQGFFTILCPTIRNKLGEMENTVDQTLIEFGKKMISLLREAYPGDNLYLAIGSGDKDFRLLVYEAIRKRFKIIVIAGNQKSLSLELRKLADRIFIFSPIEE